MPSSSEDYLAPMEVIDDKAMLAEVRAQMERFRQNSDWLQQHADAVYRQHRGKCICVAGQEMFVASSPEEAIAMATAAHPEDDGRFAEYVPLEKVPRIYAH
jgi:hypothetical protein